MINYCRIIVVFWVHASVLVATECRSVPMVGSIIKTNKRRGREGTEVGANISCIWQAVWLCFRQYYGCSQVLKCIYSSVACSVFHRGRCTMGEQLLYCNMFTSTFVFCSPVTVDVVIQRSRRAFSFGWDSNEDMHAQFANGIRWPFGNCVSKVAYHRRGYG